MNRKMNMTEQEEIEAGRVAFLKALPYIIGGSVTLAWIITSFADRFL